MPSVEQLTTSISSQWLWSQEQQGTTEKTSQLPRSVCKNLAAMRWWASTLWILMLQTCSAPFCYPWTHEWLSCWVTWDRDKCCMITCILRRQGCPMVLGCLEPHVLTRTRTNWWSFYFQDLWMLCHDATGCSKMPPVLDPGNPLEGILQEC